MKRSKTDVQAALTRAVCRAAYLGVDRIAKDSDVSEIAYIDNKGFVVAKDGSEWVVTVESKS